MAGTAALALVVGGVAPMAAIAGARPDGRHGNAAGKVWHKISTGPVRPLTQPAVLRVGKTLDVVWVQGPDGSRQIMSGLFTASTAGAQGAPHVVVGGWQSLADQAAIVPNGARRMVLFSGVRSASDPPGSPYDNSLVYLATSADGTGWALHAGSASQTALVDGTGLVAVSTSGTPTVAFDRSPNGWISFHRGVSGAAPASGPDGHTAKDPHCCATHPGIGHDARTGAVWTVWDDESRSIGWQGINAQRIFPSGGRVHAPASAVVSKGFADSAAPEQAVQVAGRPSRAGGGLYAAYAIGWPGPNKVGLWRLGARSLALTITTSYRVGDIGVAPGLGGRLWVYWVDRATQQVKLTRTNPTATRIGAIRTIGNPDPGRDNGPRSLIGDGTAGPLDLVEVNGGSSTGVYLARVLPALSTRFNRTSVPRGGTLRVTVTDAGAPVRGAVLSFLGRAARTNRSGTATLHVPATARKGRHRAAVARPGYVTATAEIRVT